MDTKPIPLIVLGGRDRRSTVLPESGRDQHLLRGYKGADVKIAGRPLVEVVVERFRRTGAFDPIYLAGPAEVFRELGVDARLVDTDRSFGLNIRAGLEAVMADFPEGQVACTTCDILPDPADLEHALDDLERHQPCDFWWVLHRVGAKVEQLGKSAWKPGYLIRPEGESEPVEVLPGHLVVADPHGIRLGLFYRVMDLTYRTRNRPVAYRRPILVRGALAALLKDDLRRLLAGKVPDTTWSILRHGLALASWLRSGSGSQAELEDHLRRMWYDRGHLKRHPERCGRLAFLDTLSLAKDIDTLEEAREVGGEAGPSR